MCIGKYTLEFSHLTTEEEEDDIEKLVLYYTNGFTIKVKGSLFLKFTNDDLTSIIKL